MSFNAITLKQFYKTLDDIMILYHVGEKPLVQSWVWKKEEQTPISITKPESKTVLISCRVSAPDFATAFIHWYRKRLNAAPEHIAYMSSRLFLANSSDDGKFSIEKDLSQSVCTLTVSKVMPQDAATYYCASWDAQQ
uniref:Ig-like domain-containing protein n=1 Tax=Apteryx owenii TaxID=8824 RepID=A0A8B9PMT8_APTOW